MPRYAGNMIVARPTRRAWRERRRAECCHERAMSRAMPAAPTRAFCALSTTEDGCLFVKMPPPTRSHSRPQQESAWPQSSTPSSR